MLEQENQQLCFYRSEPKACMPNGGINSMEGRKCGDVVKMGDGTKYQVIKCKFPNCL